MASKQQEWNELLEHQFKILSSDCLNTFKSLKTNIQRIEFIFSNDKLRNCLESWLANFVSHNYMKSDEVSEKLRIEGNNNFQKNEDHRAVQKYTQSTPQAQSNFHYLALLFANRSGRFFQMHRYKACLVAIERSLSEGYPKKLWYELFVRKGKCFIKLGQNDDAARSFDAALEYLEFSYVPSKRKDTLRQKIKALQKECVPLSSSNICNQSAPFLPPLLNFESQEVKWVSSALALKMDAFRGRHLMALVPITSGDTLIVEKAFASVLLPEHYNTHCHHCHGKLITPVGCRRCSQVQYCSEDCAEESWLKYHYIECAHLDILHSIGIAHLSLRVLLIAGIAEIIEMKDDLNRVKSPMGIPGADEKNYYRATYYTVYHLMTHEENISVEDLFAYSLTASLILMLLHHSLLKIAKLCSSPLEKQLHQLNVLNCSAHTSPADTLKYLESHKYFIGSILVHHIEQLICNAHAITSISGDHIKSNNKSLETQEQVRIASAIFPSASLMNHSCNPTIISSFYKNFVIVKSATDVPLGGEIFNCYGPHFKKMRRNARQAALQQQYYFHCKCEVCEMEKDAVDTYFAYRCVHCEGPVLPTIKKSEKFEAVMLCSECHQFHDYKNEIMNAGVSEMLFQMGEKYLEKQKYEDALQKFLKCFKLRKKIFHELNKALPLTQDRIAQCYAFQKKFEDALKYLRQSIDITARIYGLESLEYGHELQKLTDIVLKVILEIEINVKAANQKLKERLREADEFTAKGVELFTKQYGLGYEATQEFLEKQKHLTEIRSILRIPK